MITNKYDLAHIYDIYETGLFYGQLCVVLGCISTLLTFTCKSSVASHCVKVYYSMPAYSPAIISNGPKKRQTLIIGKFYEHVFLFIKTVAQNVLLN